MCWGPRALPLNGPGGLDTMYVSLHYSWTRLQTTWHRLKMGFQAFGDHGKGRGCPVEAAETPPPGPGKGLDTAAGSRGQGVGGVASAGDGPEPGGQTFGNAAPQSVTRAGSAGSRVPLTRVGPGETSSGPAATRPSWARRASCVIESSVRRTQCASLKCGHTGFSLPGGKQPRPHDYKCPLSCPG